MITDTHTTLAREGYKLDRGSRNGLAGWIVYHPHALSLADRFFASKRAANRCLLRWITFRSFDRWAARGQS